METPPFPNDLRSYRVMVVKTCVSLSPPPLTSLKKTLVLSPIPPTVLSRPVITPLLPMSHHLVQEVERLGEEEVGVHEDYLDLVQQTGLGDCVEDHAVARDERRREDGALLLLLSYNIFTQVFRSRKVRRGRGGGDGTPSSISISITMSTCRCKILERCEDIHVLETTSTREERKREKEGGREREITPVHGTALHKTEPSADSSSQ